MRPYHGTATLQLLVNGFTSGKAYKEYKITATIPLTSEYQVVTITLGTTFHEILLFYNTVS